ncbi:hypothetical protein V8F20_011734 [Naviculisporaceae sp. PSN 640]
MATYSKEQIARYLQHIRWDESTKIEQGTLAHLTELVKRQLATVPFEDISLHYSPTHRLSLKPQDLFNKVVGRNMGGYCMENNTFFGTVLRSLGFSVVNAGARVSEATGGRPGGRFMGWNHMVNIVILPNENGVPTKYLVDVGFGYNEPTVPLALVSGQVTPGIGTTEFRLEYKALPNHTDKSQRMWVFAHRDTAMGPDWTEGYAFTEMEFFPEDFEIMNLSTMTQRTSFFTQTLMCVKMTLDEETGEPKGWLLLASDEVKSKTTDGMELVDKFKTEEERVEGLKKWFGIELTETETVGIRGLSTEIRGFK